jgi:hypothetical protein
MLSLNLDSVHFFRVKHLDLWKEIQEFMYDVALETCQNAPIWTI